MAFVPSGEIIPPCSLTLMEDGHGVVAGSVNPLRLVGEGKDGATSQGWVSKKAESVPSHYMLECGIQAAHECRHDLVEVAY